MKSSPSGARNCSCTAFSPLSRLSLSNKARVCSMAMRSVRISAQPRSTSLSRVGRTKRNSVALMFWSWSVRGLIWTNSSSFSSIIRLAGRFFQLFALLQDNAESLCLDCPPDDKQYTDQDQDGSSQVFQPTDRFYASPDDEYIQSPKQAKADEFAGIQTQGGFGSRHGMPDRIKGQAPNPGLDAEPTTGDQGPHDSRDVKCPWCQKRPGR